MGAEIGAGLLNCSDSTVDSGGIPSKGKSDWGASARLRVGYAVDSWLVYASDGGAMTDAEATSTPAPGFSDSDHKTMTGWVVGVGAEKMVAQNISMRLDYSHYDYGSKTFNYDFGIWGKGTSKIETKTDLITIAMDYKFKLIARSGQSQD